MNALAASGLDSPGMWLAGGAKGAGMPGRSTNMQLLNQFGVSMRRSLPGIGKQAEVSHQDSAMGIVVAVGIAAFEGSVEASYYFTGDPLFIRARWPNERYNFPNVSQDVQFTAGYTLWHINALLDIATQHKVQKSGNVSSACYDYERDPKRTRKIVVGEPLHDEEENFPALPLDEISVKNFILDLANMPSDRPQLDRPGVDMDTTSRERREVVSRRALLLLGVVGATTDSRVRGSYEPYYHIFGARMSSTVTKMANVWRAHAHEEIGYSYGYFKVDKKHPYPYDEVWNIIALGNCGPPPQAKNDDGESVAWYLPQIVPVVCEKRNSNELTVALGGTKTKKIELKVNIPRRVWRCRAFETKHWKAFTSVFVHRLGRVMYGRQDGAIPTPRAARGAMRTYAGSKALRSGFVGDGNESGEFAVQVDIDISRRIYWQEMYPNCK